MEEASQLGFQTPHRVALLVLSLLLLGLVLELVRRQRFKERYALLWLAAAFCGVVVGIFPRLIIWIAHFAHVQFLTVVFGLSFVFLLGLVLSFSVVISRLSEHNRELAQELALLARRLKHIEETCKENEKDGPPDS